MSEKDNCSDCKYTGLCKVVNILNMRQEIQCLFNKEDGYRNE